MEKINNLKNNIEKEITKIDTLYDQVNKETTKSFELKHEQLTKEEKYSKSILSSDLGRLSQDSIIKRSESLIETNKDHGLFILGILESAANDKKMRNTVNV